MQRGPADKDKTKARAIVVPEGRQGGLRARRLLLLMAVMVTLMASSRAGACPGDVVQWASRCAENAGRPVVAEACGDGRVTVRVGEGAGSLRVEIRPARAEGFVREGQNALQPVANYADWSQAPIEVRRSFDSLRACVARGGPVIPGGDDVLSPGVRRLHGWRAAWRLLLPMGCWAWLLGLVLRRGEARREAALGLGLSAIAFVFWQLAVDAAYFHQNGHGPQWVRYATCLTSPYGPGYAAVFGPVAAWMSPGSERGVFGLQQVLMALAVAGLYAWARRFGVPRAIAGAACLAAAAHPFIGRLARSESYYATILSLLVLSSSALVLAGWRYSTKRAASWAAALAGGTTAALAATIHPVGWFALGALPWVALLTASGRVQRARGLLQVGGVVGAAGLALALGPVLRVLADPALQQWSAHAQQGRLVTAAAWLAVPVAAGLAFPRRLVVPATAIAMLVAARGLDLATNLFSRDTHVAPAYAWALLFSAAAMPGALALVGLAWAWVRRRARDRSRLLAAVLASGLLAGGSLWSWSSWGRWTALPTDALEQREMAPVLRSLPAGAQVLYMRRAGQANLALPIDSECVAGAASFREVPDSGEISLDGVTHWYRTSMCSTPEGQARCAEIESRMRLRGIVELRLPARQSLDYLPYVSPEVVVGLYDVLDR